MSVVTIDGQIGAGGSTLGRRVARMLGHEYVDRLILPGITPVSEEAGSPSRRKFSERVWTFVEKAVRGVALGNAAGDPYFATAELLRYPLTWDSSPGAPMASDFEPEAEHPQSIETLLKRGRSVLVQRAGAVALRSHQQVVKIGVFASWDDRIERVKSTLGLSKTSEAERAIRERELAQAEYFNSYYGAHPEDRRLYDVCIDTSREQINLAAVKITRAVQGSAPLAAQGV